MRIYNDGDVPLTVSGVEVGCGCISVPFDQRDRVSVPPKSSTTMEVVLSRSKMQLGEMEYPIRINFADGQKARARVLYNFAPAIVVDPAAIVLTPDQGNAEVIVTALAETAEGISFDIDDESMAVVEAHPVQSADRQFSYWKLSISASEQSVAENTATAQIWVRKDDEIVASIAVTRLADLKEEMSIEPRAVRIDLADSEGLNRVVSIKGDPTVLEGLEARCDLPFVTVIIEKVAEEHRRVQISVDEDRSSKLESNSTIRGTVELSGIGNNSDIISVIIVN